MFVEIFDDKKTLAAHAASRGAGYLRLALNRHGRANIILATGASQFEMLDALAAMPEIDWSRVDIFHLDEYIGLPETHPAGFRRYLRERFIAKLPMAPAAFHPVSLEAIPELSALLESRIIDVAFVGIGENGHLAFNDPPADFETEAAYLTIDLDDKCRRQQLNEGWFATLDEVPKRAVSMSISRIMKSRVVIATVPDRRKAQAVSGAVDGEVVNRCPASILQQHPDCFVYLDQDSSALLKSRRFF